MTRRVARLTQMAGFTLLSVMLAMSLIAGIAFLLNRDNGVNAEMVSDQMDADRARYAAEAGLQAVNASIQGNNCTGFYPSILTPLTNSNLGGASYSAFAITPFGNTTSLYSTGSYNGTSVALTRNNVIAYQATPNTYTLQPNAAAGIDSFIKTSDSANNGTQKTLDLKSAKTYPLLQFDLSAFPVGSLPLGAVISLYPSNVAGGSTVDVSMYRLTNSWVEGDGSTGVNWSTRNGALAWTSPGGDYHPVAVASVTTTTQNIWSSFDVTDLAAAWLLGRYPNNGVLLASNPLASDIQYDSSDGNTTTTRPKMAVTYLVPCGMTGPSGTSSSTTVTLNPVADAMIDQQVFFSNYGGSNSLKFSFASSFAEQRTMLKFDASGIPAGTIIQSATLRLDVTSVVSASNNPKAISAYALTQAWTEGSKNGGGAANGVTWFQSSTGTNWTSAGGTYRTPSVAVAVEESSGLSPPPGSFRTGWLSWDLKALTQEWVDGVTVNNGVLLMSTVADQHAMDSKEKGGNTMPQLVITY